MPTLVVGTAGHIDHGKSTLVQALTGVHPDRLEEEQRRGITIDLGFAHARIGDVDVAFVDVPGHERFVRHMLAGAGGLDAVLLVVDAGESVRPQTLEHFEICRLLGLDRGAIVVTKTDAVSADAIDRTTRDVRALVAGSFLADAPVLAVSARTGAGLDALRETLIGLAQTGSRQARDGVVRLPIDRVFAVKGFGTVVTGTLVSGTITVGDTLDVVPGRLGARVRGLEIHGERVQEARAPARVAVNLAGVDASELSRGLMLITPRTVGVTRRADVRLQLLAGARPLAHGARVRAHVGTAELFARVSLAAVRSAGASSWAAPGRGEAGAVVAPGGEALVRLRFEGPVCLTRGDRVILRHWSPSHTLGGATVLDPEPPGASPRRPTVLARFARLEQDAEAVALVLEEAGAAGIDAETLVRRAGLAPRAAVDALDALVAAGKASAVGRHVVDRRALEALAQRVQDAVAAFHLADPQAAGIAREALRGEVAPKSPAAVFDAVVADLASRGVITGAERLALATHRPPVVAEDARLRDGLERAIQAAGLTPPDPSSLASGLAATPQALERAAGGLVRDGRLVRTGGLLFHPESLEALKADVAGLAAGRAPGQRVVLDIAAFKARHGLTRKHAIPLLEWLDRERVTRRVGDVRVVL